MSKDGQRHRWLFRAGDLVGYNNLEDMGIHSDEVTSMLVVSVNYDASHLRPLPQGFSRNSWVHVHYQRFNSFGQERPWNLKLLSDGQNK